MKQFFVIAAVVILSFAFVGCKEKSQEEKGKEALKAAAEKVPDAPDKVVLEAAKAVKEGELVLLYAMLPDSYQKDLQDMYNKIPSKVDGAMYAKVWTLLDKAFAAAKKNKDKLAEGAPIPIDQVIAPVEEFLTLAKECKLNDYEAMKTLNIAAFLADHGKKLADYGWKTAGIFKKEEVEMAKGMMDGIKAEAKDVKDAEATVAVTGGPEPIELKFVKVEGKWIPKDLADNWKEGIAEANKELDEGLAALEKNKEQINGFLTGAEGALTKFEESGKLEDLGPVMGAMQAF